MRGVVIIGAGHAGANAAVFLRQSGYEQKIVLLSEESATPYQRPPLSKAWLTDGTTPEAIALHPPGWYEKLRIDLILGTKATAIDAAAKEVLLEGGKHLPFDYLIVATGARPRKLQLPGADLPMVHELRNMADAQRIAVMLRQAKKIAIVGGGYIGLEVAASARALGVDVTVLERESRVLARVANPQLSAFFADYHRARGVEIRSDVNVAAFESAGVRLANGDMVSADCILVGVGATGNDQLARDAGLECEPAGIRVDESARTSDTSIFAIGDVTCRPLHFHGRRGRLESVHNAMEQAKLAAFAIMGKPAPAPEVPWFWSEQYDLRLQIAGLVFGDETTILRGDPLSGKFSQFHLLNDVVVAVEAVNAAQDFVSGKKWIAGRQAVSPQRLADVAVPIKEVVA